MKDVFRGLFLILLTGGLILYLTVGTFLYVEQRDFIYFPTPAIESLLEQKAFVNQGTTIITSVINSGADKAVVYFGGNAENVDNNAWDFPDILPDYSIYLVKYRGYGGSEGNPTEENIYSDALYVFDALAKQHQSISVIGRSLGSGVATFVAANRPVEKLALITPFDSIQNVAQAQFPIYPMSVLLKDKYDSENRANKITAQTLVISAQNDLVIKPERTLKLLEAFNDKAQHTMIAKADHNNIAQFKTYQQAMAKFFKPDEGN